MHALDTPWQLPGCGDRCWRRRHDPLTHELFGRQQERLALAGSVVRTGPLTVNLDAHTALLHDLETWPSPHEQAVLEYLAIHLGSWCSNHEILLAVWGPEYVDATRSPVARQRRDTRHVLVAINRLRRRLGEHRTLIETWIARGYRLRQERVVS